MALTRALERVLESRALERGGRFCPFLLSQLLLELESPNLVSEKTTQLTLWCAILVILGQHFKSQMGSNLNNMDIFGEMTDLHLLRSSAIPIIDRIKPKQTCDSS